MYIVHYKRKERWDEEIEGERTKRRDVAMGVRRNLFRGKKIFYVKSEKDCCFI